jgi:hypothetical protein
MPNPEEAAALRRELAGYEARGMLDRANQVREVLGEPPRDATDSTPRRRAVPPKRS